MLPAHPLADTLPMPTQEEMDRLVESVRRHKGVYHDPIITHEGQVLEGRSRQMACKLAGFEPTYREYAGEFGTPAAFVVAKNIVRRSLNPSQLAMAALRVKELLQQGKYGDLPAIEGSKEATKEAAKMTGASYRHTQRAAAIVEKAPELRAPLEHGDVRVRDAEPLAAAPKKKRKKALAKLQSGEAPTAKAALKSIDEEDMLADAEQQEKSLDDVIKEKNHAIEHFCRSLLSWVTENWPKDDPWLDDIGRSEGAMQKVKDACSLLRTAKCAGACPKCEGQGCVTCHQTGRVPKHTLDRIGD